MDDLHEGLSDSENGDGVRDLELPSAAEKKHYASPTSVTEPIRILGRELHDNLNLIVESPETGSDEPSEDDGSSSSIDDEIILAYGIDPSRKGSISEDEDTPDSHSENESFTRPLPRAIDVKLVSALKGGREKEGLPPRKLSVSWAPDVYDPPPTSLSHHPKKKEQKQFKSNKKYGKGKQKSKNMRGGGSCPKDKKHYTKLGGRSERCLDSFSDTDRVSSTKSSQKALPKKQKSSAKVASHGDYDDYDDYDDDHGIPESSCGGSFRGKAGRGMHFAYAEA